MLSFFDDNEKIKEDEIKSSSLLKEKEEKEEKEEISLNDILNDVNDLKKSLNDVLEIVKLLQNKGGSNNGTNTDDN